MTAASLTPHQAEVLGRIMRAARVPGTDTFTRPVDERHIGSKGALAHLMHKRYIEIHHVERGPRGGTTRFFVPTEQGGEWQRRRIIRMIAAKKESQS